MIVLWLLACGIPAAQADDLQHNHGLVRIEFSDAVCFCMDGGDWHGGSSCIAAVSCFPKPAPTVEKTP